MNHDQCRDLVPQCGELSRGQKRQASEVLQTENEAAESLAAIELSVDEARTCPRCNSPGVVARGKNRGLRRYLCKVCGRTFNATTNTPLQGLHHKERWLTYGQSLSNGETVHESAERCKIAPSTAFRWRHRFLQAVEQALPVMEGIVEADETYLLHSYKGQAEARRKCPGGRHAGVAVRPPSRVCPRNWC